jgi:tRNA(fMet)-specific endonuclease VapC
MKISKAGVARSLAPQKRCSQLESLVPFVNILSFGMDEVRVAAVIRAVLESKDTPIGPYDVLIAGTALS